MFILFFFYLIKTKPILTIKKQTEKQDSFDKLIVTMTPLFILKSKFNTLEK